MRTAVKNIAKAIIKNNEIILLNNNLINIPSGNVEVAKSTIGTIFANLAYYGYTLSKECIKSLMTCSDEQVSEWWNLVQPALKEVTGDNRNMGEHVVYKNFPKEVLEMSQSEYWIKQSCIYAGFPVSWFTQEELDREKLNEKITLKVLHLANEKSLQNIFTKLGNLPAKWTEEQLVTVNFLIKSGYTIKATDIPFKGNMVLYVKQMLDMGATVILSSATDVMRVAIGMSDGDITMKSNSKFKKFSRKERKFLLGLLENSSNLNDDVARDTERWKRLMYNLHPNDYKKQFPRVSAAYDLLYNDNTETFNSKVEAQLSKKTLGVFTLLKSRPGEFMRRLNQMIEIYGNTAVTEFISILPKLTISQLLKLEGYLSTVNDRIFKTIAPKGNWSKLQIVNNDNKISEDKVIFLLYSISSVIKTKLVGKIPFVNLSEDTKLVKLQTNDSELSSYGRGTVFPIPANINFIRSASYWENKTDGVNWFDNGWNLFDVNWKSMGACSWSETNFRNAVVFSGDPTNSKTVDGKACQMIDIYLDKLLATGVRYAVWNILCYSNIKFSDATEVFGALQWGENAQSGGLFEPSRAQLAFPLKGNNLTKYIAYIDLVERKLVYMDANLKGQVQNAGANNSTLENVMPAFVEYLDTIPSIYDLFSKLDNNETGLPVVYVDDTIEIKEQEAYVFKPVNKNNTFTQVNVNELLNL